MSDKTNIMQLNKPLFDEMGWDEFLRQNADIIEGYVGKEHNPDGTHKSINTPEVNTSIVRFADGSSANTGSAVAGAGTLQDVITAGSTANTSSDLIVRNSAGTQELLNVSATKGLQGMLGNIADPLVQIPLRRADDATRLSGVQTFTRAGTATYIDPTDGLLKTAAIDEPRFERMADGGVGVKLEWASTNLVPNSTDLTTMSQRGTASIATSVVLSPDGSSTMFLASGLGTGGVDDAYATLGLLTASLRYEPSVWMQQATSITGVVRLRIKTSSSVGGQWSIDVSKLSSTKPERITRNHPAVTVNVEFVGDGSSNDHFSISSDGVATDVYIWGAQLEALPFASSYIPTTGTALTRAADKLNISASGNLPDDRALTIIADVEHFDNRAYSSYVFHMDGTNKLAILSGGNGDNLDVFDGVQHEMLAGTYPPNTVSRVAIIRNGHNMHAYIDGANLISPSMTYASRTDTTKLIIGGHPTAAASLWGRIRNFRIYDKALTDQEIASA